MPLKLKATAMLAIAGAAALGAIGLSGPAARAATLHCGPRCVTLAAQSLGSKEVIAVSGNGSVLMAPGFNPKEDFIGLPVGTVAELAQAGKISKSLAAIYGQEVVYELSYAPYGALTGQCLGVASPTAGAAVTLQHCGAPTNDQPTPSWEAQKGTLWIGVYRDHSGSFQPYVNVAASTHGSVVLTAGAAGGALKIKFMSDVAGTVASNQMWESVIGVNGSTSTWITPTGNEPSWPAR